MCMLNLKTHFISILEGELHSKGRKTLPHIMQGLFDLLHVWMKSESMGELNENYNQVSNMQSK